MKEKKRKEKRSVKYHYGIIIIIKLFLYGGTTNCSIVKIKFKSQFSRLRSIYYGNDQEKSIFRSF